VSSSAVPVSPFRGYRFPPEIITDVVWLYHRFALSHRDVEELLAERAIHVSYEAIRLWCASSVRCWPASFVDATRDAATVVPGRGGAHDEQTPVLAVARRGSGWDRAGHLGAKSARPARRRALPASRAGCGGRC
jgi:hypothetical protein